MAQDLKAPQAIDLTNELPADGGVCFDPDNVVLQGCYSDEISAFRAKKLWAETLQANFLLEPGYDFRLSVSSSLEENKFQLVCTFLTACGRYAFWRVTNNQAPEAQYVIETAHIPMSQSHQEDILRAPDMRSIHEEPLILGSDLNDYLYPRKQGFSRRIKNALAKLLR
jgi:hypothetical protein